MRLTICQTRQPEHEAPRTTVVGARVLTGRPAGEGEAVEPGTPAQGGELLERIGATAQFESSCQCSPQQHTWSKMTSLQDDGHHDQPH